MELAQNRWITAHQCILVAGPSGSGKSFLAEALAQHACRAASALILRLPTLLTHLVQRVHKERTIWLLKRLAKLSLLVIDHFGLAALSKLEKQDRRICSRPSSNATDPVRRS